MAASKASRARLASSESLRGTATSMVTSMSPVREDAATPLPRRRITVPDWVPGLILTFVVDPSSSGTSTVAPKAASARVTGRSMRRLTPSME